MSRILMVIHRVIFCKKIFFSVLFALIFIPLASSSENQNVSNRKIESRGDALIGISAIPQNWQDTEKDWQKLFLDVKKLNAEVLGGCNLQWHEIEPEPGVYDWSSMERFFKVKRLHGKNLKFSCDFPGLFFHDRKDQLPRYVQSLSISDPKLFEYYSDLLQSYLQHYGEHTDYLVIHAEGAYSFFKNDFEKLNDYINFLSKVRAMTKRIHPNILFGVNTDPHNKDNVLQEFNNVVDFIAYDIGQIEELLEEPSDIEEVTQRLINISNGKRIAFQNAGWSTSDVENSSEQSQVEFIINLFETLGKHRHEIEYVNYYNLYDENLEFMLNVYRAMFPDYPKEFLEKMVKSLGRTGIFKEDSEPKSGYYELKMQIKDYLESRPDEAIRY